MNERALHYYIEIVRQGSISRAAESLHIAQPPLSQQLKRLEEELGVQLIVRQQKKWMLTPAGEAFYDYAIQALQQSKDIKFYLQELQEGTVGSLRIGVASSCYNLLLEVIEVFHQQYPKVKISIHTGMSHLLLQQLKKGEIDIALLLKLEGSYGYEWKALKEQHSIAIVPKSYQCNQKEVSLKSLVKDKTFIMLGTMEGHRFTEQLENYFIQHDCVPDRIIECRDIEIATQLVAKGMGVAVIPKMELNLFYENHLQQITLSDFHYPFYPVAVRINEPFHATLNDSFWALF